MSGWWLAGLGGAGMIVVFLVAWWWSDRVSNYSWVDAVWAFGIGVTAMGWLAFSEGHPRHWVAGAMVGLWSFRLGNHLQRRIRKHHPEEDARYVKLRQVWEGRVRRSFFFFFQAQAVSVVVLALPFLAVAMNRCGGWGVWESVGGVFVITGLVGEALADAQMGRFKRENPGPERVCRDGLWYYSRHPNYFFEAVVWCGFYVFACGSGWGWATVHAPLIIVYLLLKVTGIPPTEASALRRKGDAYRAYQESTSAFIPWPPKRASTSSTRP